MTVDRYFFDYKEDDLYDSSKLHAFCALSDDRDMLVIYGMIDKFNEHFIKKFRDFRSKYICVGVVHQVYGMSRCGHELDDCEDHINYIDITSYTNFKNSVMEIYEKDNCFSLDCIIDFTDIYFLF